MIYFNIKTSTLVVDSPVRTCLRVNIYAILIIYYALYMCIWIKFVINDPNYPGHFLHQFNMQKEERRGNPQFHAINATYRDPINIVNRCDTDHQCWQRDGGGYPGEAKRSCCCQYRGYTYTYANKRYRGCTTRADCKKNGGVCVSIFMHTYDNEYPFWVLEFYEDRAPIWLYIINYTFFMHFYLNMFNINYLWLFYDVYMYIFMLIFCYQIYISLLTKIFRSLLVQQ